MSGVTKANKQHRPDGAGDRHWQLSEAPVYRTRRARLSGSWKAYESIIGERSPGINR